MKASPSYKMQATWSAPANIAIVKYWGKYGAQLPQNPSISFTLQKSCTITQIRLLGDLGPALDFTFAGSPQETFQQKIAAYFQRHGEFFPHLLGHHLQISSHNTFPHSAGIASSASSMAALVLAALSLEWQLSGKVQMLSQVYQRPEFFTTASFLARAASGSAARSLFAPVASWGSDPQLDSDQEHGAVVKNPHPHFTNMRDSILLVSSRPKAVSSSLGHQLMDGHVFQAARIAQARENTQRLLAALANGNLPAFIEVLEEEALTLHALMLTSRPSFILWEAESLVLMEKIRLFRQRTGLPVGFTFDAGPNLHLLYPASIAPEVVAFIQSELLPHCENRQWIDDHVGQGPELINE